MREARGRALTFFEIAGCVAFWLWLRPSRTRGPGRIERPSENKQYRLALADALAASRLDDEAQRVLLALREAQPEDAETNLRLARLQARGSDADATRRYYQNALAGLWRPKQAEERRRVRIELIRAVIDPQGDINPGSRRHRRLW